MNNFVPDANKWVNYYVKQARGGVQEGGNPIYNIGSKTNVAGKDFSNLFLPSIPTSPENDALITQRVEANLRDMSRQLNPKQRQSTKLIKRKHRRSKSSNAKKSRKRRPKLKNTKRIKKNKRKPVKNKKNKKSNKRNTQKVKHRNKTIF